MKILKRAELQAASDLPHVDVAVPEWGEDVGVRIRTLNAGERQAWEGAMFVVTLEEENGKLVQKRTPRAGFNMKTHLLGLCLVDEDGARLFQNDETALLDSKNSAVVDRLFGLAMRHNAIGGTAIEDAEKNSERTAADSSSSV